MKISEILTEYRKTPELNAVMKFFLHDEYADMVFAVVVPKESGLSRSVWCLKEKHIHISSLQLVQELLLGRFERI